MNLNLNLFLSLKELCITQANNVLLEFKHFQIFQKTLERSNIEIKYVEMQTPPNLSNKYLNTQEIENTWSCI